MPEIWLPVVGWEGLYDVSSLGNVRSHDRHKDIGRRKFYPGVLLRPTEVESGHQVVTLRYSPIKERVYVHRRVARAHIPNPQGHKLVRHLNDNPSDNRVENLAWGTYSDNAQDRERNNPRPERTHCVRGHEMNDQNRRLQQGSWVCRRCNTELARLYRERKRVSNE